MIKIIKLANGEYKFLGYLGQGKGYDMLPLINIMSDNREYSRVHVEESEMKNLLELDLIEFIELEDFVNTNKYRQLRNESAEFFNKLNNKNRNYSDDVQDDPSEDSGKNCVLKNAGTCSCEDGSCGIADGTVGDRLFRLASLGVDVNLSPRDKNKDSTNKTGYTSVTPDSFTGYYDEEDEEKDEENKKGNINRNYFD